MNVVVSFWFAVGGQVVHVRSLGRVGSANGDALRDDREGPAQLAGVADEVGELIAVQWVGKSGRCGHGEVRPAAVWCCTGRVTCYAWVGRRHPRRRAPRVRHRSERNGASECERAASARRTTSMEARVGVRGTAARDAQRVARGRRRSVRIPRVRGGWQSRVRTRSEPFGQSAFSWRDRDIPAPIQSSLSCRPQPLPWHPERLDGHPLDPGRERTAAIGPAQAAVVASGLTALATGPVGPPVLAMWAWRGSRGVDHPRPGARRTVLTPGPVARARGAPRPTDRGHSTCCSPPILNR